MAAALAYGPVNSAAFDTGIIPAEQVEKNKFSARQH